MFMHIVPAKMKSWKILDDNPLPRSDNAYVELWWSITHGDADSKKQALVNLRNLKFVDGSEMERSSLYDGLLTIRGDTSLLHIAAENGMTLPLISVLRDREHGLLSRGQETLHTILMLVLQSGNYKLFIFLVKYLKADEAYLVDALTAKYSYPLLNHIISTGIKSNPVKQVIKITNEGILFFEYISGFRSLDVEPSKIAKKSEWKFEQKGGRERCFAFNDDLSDLMMDNRMTDQERHSHAEAILTILHEYAIFCP